MDGIIIVDKPQGWTSFDVVAKIRNLSGVKKVGHSGTLDPMATGVLAVFLGKATKTIQYFLNGDKGYEGEMVLGIKTDTGDADGKPINPKSEILNPDVSLRKVGIPLERSEHRDKSEIQISKSEIEKIFAKYTGEIEQVPPMYSAVKVNGQRLYELARKGVEVERKPRKVTIYELRLTEDDSSRHNVGTTAGRVSFYVKCSKGTYIRQLAVDIGDDLVCGAHLSKLRRVYSHPFKISQAIAMEKIITLAKDGRLETAVMPLSEISHGFDRFQ